MVGCLKTGIWGPASRRSIQQIGSITGVEDLFTCRMGVASLKQLALRSTPKKSNSIIQASPL